MRILMHAAPVAGPANPLRHFRAEEMWSIRTVRGLDRPSVDSASAKEIQRRVDERR
jgi:hypothetical protein